MAVNEKLTSKIREALNNVPNVEEKKIFSGIAFMVNDKLCIGVSDNRIMCRVDPVVHDELIKKPGCTTTVMQGKAMKGYVYVDESVLNTKEQIDFWVKLALDFNPKAKASAKRKLPKSTKKKK